jgi:CHAT domain-containing protein
MHHTEGLRFSIQQQKQKKEENRMDLVLGQKITYYDDPLLRSGLIMAGANYLWKEGKTIEGTDNGILTARELSDLNLNNTKLAVLSACETALGDVKGDEGVYGLQRALFMAGVKNIVVSLWSVPVNETLEMMTLFVNNMATGHTIEEAFHSAQQTMKQKYYDDPKSWAGFVLIQ